MSSRKTIDERIDYVRNHITDSQRVLSEALGVSQVTAARYRRHIRFGEPISGKFHAKKMVEERPTMPQRLHSIEGKVDMLTELVGELAKPRSKRGLFFRK